MQRLRETFQSKLLVSKPPGEKGELLDLDLHFKLFDASNSPENFLELVLSEEKELGQPADQLLTPPPFIDLTKLLEPLYIDTIYDKEENEVLQPLDAPLSSSPDKPKLGEIKDKSPSQQEMELIQTTPNDPMQFLNDLSNRKRKRSLEVIDICEESDPEESVIDLTED